MVTVLITLAGAAMLDVLDAAALDLPRLTRRRSALDSDPRSMARAALTLAGPRPFGEGLGR